MVFVSVGAAPGAGGEGLRPLLKLRCAADTPVSVLHTKAARHAAASEAPGGGGGFPVRVVALRRPPAARGLQRGAELGQVAASGDILEALCAPDDGGGSGSGGGGGSGSGTGGGSEGEAPARSKGMRRQESLRPETVLCLAPNCRPFSLGKAIAPRAFGLHDRRRVWLRARRLYRWWCGA